MSVRANKDTFESEINEAGKLVIADSIQIPAFRVSECHRFLRKLRRRTLRA